MLIRPAEATDLPRIATIVAAAYAHYIPRMGRRPGPMLDDFAAQVAAGWSWVAGDPADGVLVLIAAADHLLLENVAVDPAAAGRGIGGALLDFAEAQCRARGLPELRLYTHIMMTENIDRYRRRGFHETGRAEQDGLSRVFFAKPIPA